MLGDIGGFNSAIIILPTYVIKLYSEKMFNDSLSEQIPVRQSRKRNKNYSKKLARSILLDKFKWGSAA